MIARAGAEAGARRRTAAQVPFVDLPIQYRALRDEVDAAIASVLKRFDFILGEPVASFEAAFADYCQASHAVGVDSGFSALELILSAYGIGPGDEVITAANAFHGTVAAIESCGARPVLVDVDPTTYTLDPTRIAPAISRATRAVIPVHLYGHPADMDSIGAVTREYGLLVFEDAGQAPGARYRGRRTGSLGDAAAYSFYSRQNPGPFGDAGMVVTSDAAVAERVRWLRNLSTPAKLRYIVKGRNRRLDTVQAAALHVKLRHLDDSNASRRRIAALYSELLSSLPVGQPEEASWAEHVYHLYVIEAAERDALQNHLARAGIVTAVHYPVPVPGKPAHLGPGEWRRDRPVTERCAGRILSLPMYPGMPPDASAYVTAAIRTFYEG